MKRVTFVNLPVFMEKIRSELRKNIFLVISPGKFSKILSGKSEKPDPESLHHLRNVLRKSGEIQINLCCGDGRILASRMGADDLIQKINEEAISFPRAIKTSLISPGIMRKNLEYMIKKTVEIGVDSISFINSDYQNYPVEKAGRYEKIITSACEQSKNPFFPQLEIFPGKIYEYAFKKNTLYLWGDPGSELLIHHIKKEEYASCAEICYINGPEGGWSAGEINFLKNRFRSVRLSDNVLRAETAAIVALFYIKLLV